MTQEHVVQSPMLRGKSRAYGGGSFAIPMNLTALASGAHFFADDGGAAHV
jgi:hypothetical protein